MVAIPPTSELTDFKDVGVLSGLAASPIALADEPLDQQHRPRAAEQLQRPAHQGTDDEPRVEVRPMPHPYKVGPGLLEPVPSGIATLPLLTPHRFLQELEKGVVRVVYAI